MFVLFLLPSIWAPLGATTLVCSLPMKSGERLAPVWRNRQLWPVCRPCPWYHRPTARYKTTTLSVVLFVLLLLLLLLLLLRLLLMLCCCCFKQERSKLDFKNKLLWTSIFNFLNYSTPIDRARDLPALGVPFNRRRHQIPVRATAEMHSYRL